MLQTLWEFRFILAAVAFAVMYGFIQWSETKSRLYALMLQAKSLAKDAVLQSGEQQFEWVIARAYQYIPGSFKLFVSEDMLKKIVRWLYKQGKDYLDDGKFNNSIK